MAAGRAVVATDVGGVKDILGRDFNPDVKPDVDFKVLERGIIVKPDDYLSFACALNLAMREKELREEMGKRGREYVKSMFSKKRLITDIQNLYDSILYCNS